MWAEKNTRGDMEREIGKDRELLLLHNTTILITRSTALAFTVCLIPISRCRIIPFPRCFLCRRVTRTLISFGCFHCH